jgi:signal transduction histidine kinase
VLRETTQACASALSRRVASVVGADVVTVGLVDDNRSRVDLLAAAGPGADRLPSGTTLRLTGAARVAVQEELPWVTTLYADGDDDIVRHLGTGSLGAVAVLPFATHLPVAGALVLGWGRARAIADETLSRARAVLHADLTTLHALLIAEHEHRRARRLDELLMFRDDMVQTVAHDLATPLGVVSGFTRLIRQRRGDGEDLDRWLGAIARNAVELETLVGNLRDIMRIERGPLPADQRPFDVTALCREVVGDLVCTTDRTIELTATPATVVGDVELTRRVLHNLLSNARKYSGSGRPIEVAVEDDETRVRVHVRDHGPGIPAERQAELFDRFSRLHLEEHEGVCGTGLGLYISRILTEAQGGTIGVESEPGEGATFTVTLPREPLTA